jgi:hypothetical protein
VPAVAPGNRGEGKLIGAYGNVRGNAAEGRRM